MASWNPGNPKSQWQCGRTFLHASSEEDLLFQANHCVHSPSFFLTFQIERNREAEYRKSACKDAQQERHLHSINVHSMSVALIDVKLSFFDPEEHGFSHSRCLWCASRSSAPKVHLSHELWKTETGSDTVKAMYDANHTGCKYLHGATGNDDANKRRVSAASESPLG